MFHVNPLRHIHCVLSLFMAGILALPAFAHYGPRIMIWADGELVLDAALRDNDAIAAKNLANFLTRVAFENTDKIKIKASEADAERAVLKANFELHLTVNDGKGKEPPPPVLKVNFTELRLARSKSKREQWFLTSEGIELIEKAIPKQKR
jgi:hypothetical protein